MGQYLSTNIEISNFMSQVWLEIRRSHVRLEGSSGHSWIYVIYFRETEELCFHNDWLCCIGLYASSLLYKISSEITMQCTSGQIVETSLTADINYSGQPSVLVPISSPVYKVVNTWALHMYVVQSGIKTNPSVWTDFLSYFVYCTWAQSKVDQLDCLPLTSRPADHNDVTFSYTKICLLI